MRTLRTIRLLCVLGLLAVPASWAAQPNAPRKRVVDIVTVKPLKANPQNGKLRSLQVRRFNEILSELKMLVVRMAGSTSATDAELFDASRRLLHTAADFDEAKERAALLKDVLAQTKELSTLMEAQHKAEMLRTTDVSRFRSLVFEVEVNLLRAETAVKNGR